MESNIRTPVLMNLLNLWQNIKKKCLVSLAFYLTWVLDEATLHNLCQLNTP